MIRSERSSVKGRRSVSEPVVQNDIPDDQGFFTKVFSFFRKKACFCGYFPKNDMAEYGFEYSVYITPFNPLYYALYALLKRRKLSRVLHTVIQEEKHSPYAERSEDF